MRTVWVLALALIIVSNGCNKPEDGGGSVSRDYIAIGDKAPDFKLPSYPMDEFKLADYRGRKSVVVYFYPKDNTPDCTREACAFRDTAQEFAKNGAVIVGISQDDRSSHELFADEYDLPFPLLTDHSNKVRAMFGNPDGRGALIKRITYVIDPDGIVREIINERNSDLSEHVVKALATVTDLSDTSS